MLTVVPCDWAFGCICHPPLLLVQVAESLGWPVPWAMNTASPVFRGLRDLMAQCLSTNPLDRPTIGGVLATLAKLRAKCIGLGIPVRSE